MKYVGALAQTTKSQPSLPGWCSNLDYRYHSVDAKSMNCLKRLTGQ